MPAEKHDLPYHHGNLRTALLDAAERVLQERGADQVALRDLARTLGVSHGAPRRHFPNRQALLDALAEAGFARLDTVLCTATAVNHGDFSQRFRATMLAYTRFAIENAALLELMYASKHRPEATRIIQAAEAPVRRLYDLILQGQATGALHAGDPEQLGMIVFATLQGIASVINGNIFKPELLEQLIETAADQFLSSAPLPPRTPSKDVTT